MRVVTVPMYSPELCRQNPSSLFVFGDNLLRYGKKGQAVIRDEPNSFGLATKRKPSMTPGSFLNDNPVDTAIVLLEISRLADLANSGRYDTIVFPANGLGTGLAQMPSRAPKLYATMVLNLKTQFGIYC